MAETIEPGSHSAPVGCALMLVVRSLLAGVDGCKYARLGQHKRHGAAELHSDS